MSRTEEALIAAYEAGELTEEEQEKFLAGEDLGDTTEDSPTTDTEEKQADTVTEKDESAEGSKPVVLARDGVHTIPYSRMEELQEKLESVKAESDQLRSALEEQKGLMAKLTAAQQEDEKTGETTATDSILALLEEDYPGITAELHRSIAAPLKADIEPLKANREAEEKASVESQARAAFDASIAALEPTYPQVIKTGEFWDWFEKQSPLIRAAQVSSDPAVIAEVVKLYNSQQTQASDTGKAEADAKVREAIEKAQSRSTVQTLSDVPGGSSPATNAIDAFTRMGPREQEAYMLKLSDSEREKLLNKLV
jgi:hypothetical protein